MGAARRTVSFDTAAAGALALAALLALSGCEIFRGGSAPSSPPPPKSSTSSAKPPTQRYNLTGYSAAFKQGYADACATPRKRDAERLKSDIDYQMGWSDGQSLCRTR
jgi:hypothetical protein